MNEIWLVVLNFNGSCAAYNEMVSVITRAPGFRSLFLVNSEGVFQSLFFSVISVLFRVYFF